MKSSAASVTIDGSRGEGGGQILRTSLALSLITGKPFRMVRVRAGREKPGLARQHVTSVLAAAAVGNAEHEGAEVGSQELAFRPGPVTPRHFTFPIGTAGSTTLVLQTVLPALLLAEGASRVTVEGGTYNTKAPPYDFVEKAFVPLVNKMAGGGAVGVEMEAPGFYPAGGGRIHARIEPVARLRPLLLEERGEITSRRAVSVLARLPVTIAERELAVVRERLGWLPEALRPRQLTNGRSPGNALLIEVESEHLTEVFSAIGAIGVSAEQVAGEAVNEAEEYLSSGAAVGFHLADQLLLPMALAAHAAAEAGEPAVARESRYLTIPLTQHTLTNIETIRQFLPRVRVEHEGVPGKPLVRVRVTCE